MKVPILTTIGQIDIQVPIKNVGVLFNVKVGRVINDDDDTHVFFYRENIMPMKEGCGIDGAWIERLSAEPALSKCRKDRIEVEEVGCVAYFGIKRVIVDRVDITGDSQKFQIKLYCPQDLVVKRALQIRDARQLEASMEAGYRRPDDFVKEPNVIFCEFYVLPEEIDAFEPEELD